MSDYSDPQARLAVLIDADNTPPGIIQGLVGEIARYGIASVKRIYGDWTSPNLRGWKDHLLEHAIHPVQQFRYTVGKNATDSAMIIDGMDLLYTGRFNGFCIVSSDSDFTRLAQRVREGGLLVYGFGQKKTPKPFVSACDKFIYLEVLQVDDDVDSASSSGSKKKKKQGERRKFTAKELQRDDKLVNLLLDACEDSVDDDGWAEMGRVGQRLLNRKPDFDPRNWGYRKLSDLINATKMFEVEKPEKGHKVYIRDLGEE